MLRFKMLGSGSSGNSTVVEAHAECGVSRHLIDCGLSLRQVDLHLARAGLSVEMIDAAFSTHEHRDHIGSATKFALRGRKTLWRSEGSYEAIGKPDLEGLKMIASGAVPVKVGDLHVIPFSVPHDAQEPLQPVCSFGLARLGVATDLGHATPCILEHLAGCHALILECNHNLDLLIASRYPPFLKKRVGGSVWTSLQYPSRRNCQDAVSSRLITRCSCPFERAQQSPATRLGGACFGYR